LELFAPDEQLRKSGKFDTGVVGEIDFLFRTPADDLLICELKRNSTDQTVGQICRYLGWAMETIGKGRRVHGLILARDITESLRFALKATNDNISCRELVLDVTLGPSFR
jgi:RecB family endonuclease NucS